MKTPEYIVEKAYRLFLNHSYEAVSISMISNAIGMTKGALYHHFKNKEELFKAVIDEHFSKNLTSTQVDFQNITLAEYTDVCIEHSSKLLKAVFSQDKDFAPINYFSLLSDSFKHYDGFADVIWRFVDGEIGQVKIIVQNAIRRGEIRSDIDTHLVAIQYLTLSMGMASDILQNRSIDSAIKSLGNQLNFLFKLLKV